jgi:hypothetical protein
LKRYHQKVPDETPVIDGNAIHGLAEPELYKIPEPNSLWSPGIYDSFNLSKGVNVKEKKGRDISVEPVKENPM